MIKYDLEERTAKFAEKVRDFCIQLPKNDINSIYVNQLLRSASSVGANYIEANDAIGTKDFQMKIKTCRREAKESRYWIGLVLTTGKAEMEEKREILKQEAKELVLLFSTILKKHMESQSQG